MKERLDKILESIVLDDEKLFKWLKNVAFFTAPALAIFFFQLSQGVEIEIAFSVALLAFYGMLSDYLKKLKE